MRGGLERWKRGVGSQGVRQALAYAFQGSCDSHLRSTAGAEALASYSAAGGGGVTRFVVEDGAINADTLDEEQLRRWVDGRDPATDERRGRDLTSPDADLILDGTINAPKSYSIAAMLNADLAAEFEALQDRLRDRILTTWQTELNARRGAGGRIRELLRRVEVVELQHRRSRALDPHIHRHLWLNVKVLGQDGKWSNVDSRVAMKMQTVINAEGELAARTDPQWLDALARHGLTLDAGGEIAELAHAVRPLSRRSTQIEATRAVLLASWHGDHPGLEPSPDELHRIDRLAWARARPNKPGDVDEGAWEQLIADELAAIDPAILRDRDAVPADRMPIDKLDRDLLAAQAVVEADARSACCGGRFSLFDVRAGATRAVAASGVVAQREHLQPVIDDVIVRALTQTVDMLEGEPDRPAHIKGYMASSTAAAKVELAARFDELAIGGASADQAEVLTAASAVLQNGIQLEGRQVEAAAAIAGTDRLVSITGPAGAGKTTMLRAARAALAHRGRRMVVVAPTKKAASVAGREIGTSASSLHALLSDHGFRWGRDPAGAEIWTRLTIGEIDPATGFAYAGPSRYRLAPGDRVVVDEAGMVDLYAANALAAIAAESGAGIAMVGDHMQARPVGHSGAMATMTRRATAVVELTAVHRFTDPGYAVLTLRMREPASKDAALAVATDLAERGLIHRVVDHVQARDVMVESYLRWAAGQRRVALVTSTNEEADAINEAIQQRRVDRGELALSRIAVGQGEQRLLEGDVVQTRRNDRSTGVENRAVWTVHRITSAGLELRGVNDAIDTRVVSLEYAAEHVHLAYASTVHGIQGETTDSSIVGPGVDASGLYVGMTRGRAHNEAIAIARTDAVARDQIADSMMRGIPEVSIDDSVRAARSELARAARSPGGTAGDELRELSGWMRDARRKLLELDSQISGFVANQHGRRSDGGALRGLKEDRIKLGARYAATENRYDELLRQVRDSTHAAGEIRDQDLAAPIAFPSAQGRVGLR
ncbi:AAA family ATPase [Microbacterium dextranolyticum]|uniref:TraA/ATP-dependent exoDNAse/relaxase n=1 Tax=Microbacterium dextranolyticum TaxID=36806 RepID=A0A9W6HJN4_9MICO|nr:AAA family ATPase [Microbacterium dextranolyticum]MBM7462167.1 energy-coupling factor transporter ATP-binding protein EcfA2 [Microbacterium dextranolyticum]GLJ94416.1 TraA/ATP-dependent exoDNAse/relaxase [Microbacterium dextranolyticum]